MVNVKGYRVKSHYRKKPASRKKHLVKGYSVKGYRR